MQASYIEVQPFTLEAFYFSHFCYVVILSMLPLLHQVTYVAVTRKEVLVLIYSVE